MNASRSAIFFLFGPNYERGKKCLKQLQARLIAKRLKQPKVIPCSAKIIPCSVA
jgi:hypothetical protein